ncbi:MAG TPA: sigma factor-like helix-turn-helix DNA-binding protein [Pirellulales bacterium]|jgi:RNA polymerase sigma factor (sigma-70 family)|nr:sigma factor-like helix-turn-helix DNA-binding protein [Pirellulales bacterium]
MYEMYEELSLATSDLSAEARQLLYWRFYDGESLSQIAERLGITSQAVQWRLQKLLGSMRNKLPELY